MPPGGCTAMFSAVHNLPVVPPPGAVSADITPGNRKDRKSTPNL